MKVNSLILILLIFCTVSFASGARILALFPYIGKSHFFMFEPYIKELASRGHQVVVVSHFPQNNPVPNLKDISLVGSVRIPPTDRLNLSDITGLSGIKTVVEEITDQFDSCNKTLSFHTVQNLIHSEESFDLVIAEMFFTDCFVPFAHKFKAPLIGISSCQPFPWLTSRMGNPQNPSFVPNMLTPFSDKMNFIQRMMNTLFGVALQILHCFQETFVTQKYVNQHFGEEIPPLSELVRNTSIFLVNNHFGFNRPRPLLPSVIEVGGLHIKSPKKLPNDLEEFLNGAEHGVIYFSLGSMIRTTTLPSEKRDAFLQAFAELPQRVLWKWEGDIISGQPENVKISKWLPQFDVLNHPNVRAYMSHGGLLGTTEAVYAGVPIIGIPFFGDQAVNTALIEEANMGVGLYYSNISKDTVLKALKTVLEDPSYRENAKRMSRIYKDRPQSAMDTAIFWTEYVIRHKGAPHLRTAALDLSWYQYLLLDVLAVLAIPIVTVLTAVLFIVRKMLSFLKKKTKKEKKNKEEKTKKEMKNKEDKTKKVKKN